MTATGVHRVRVHLPARDGMPETVRGVASEIRCGTCNRVLRGKDHAAARRALREHRVKEHT